MAATTENDSAPVVTLLDAVEARIPARRELAAKLMTQYAKSSIFDVKVENIMNGMRGLPCVLWEISQTDEFGVKYHGKTLRELENILPKWRSSEQISPEAILWFLYTATVPTTAQLEGFVADLAHRAELPQDVKDICDNISPKLPPSNHALIALSLLSRHSKFSAALEKGVSKTELWRYAFEDALDSTARTPSLVSRIYSNVYREGRDRDLPLDPSCDLAHNFALRMGRASDTAFIELTRMYWALHMDHGTSVSAHATRLCSSAWTDSYLSLSAGLIAGMGSLHAKAITDTVGYNFAMSKALGPDPSSEAIEGFILQTISKGLVVPGYGHAMLRGKDPRLEFMSRFTSTYENQPPVQQNGKGSTPALSLKLMRRAHALVPDLLRVHVPRMKNPAPNVDALSGCILLAYGVEPEALVLFASCSRAMGVMSQYVWDRALGLPLERPLSVTMDEILAKADPDNSGNGI